MRVITGTLRGIDGLVIPHVPISFTLIDERISPTSSFDAVTLERITGTEIVETDVNGHFSVSLYENSKLVDRTAYLVKIDSLNDEPFIATLNEGTEILDWLEFKTLGQPVEPAQLFTLNEYIAQAEASALQAVQNEQATAADVLTTTADRLQTAEDRSQTEADRIQTAADRLALEALFDNFDDRFLGSKAEDPLVDNDGDPLSAGAVYWNTVEPEVRFYNGAVWEAPTSSAVTAAANALASKIEAQIILETIQNAASIYIQDTEPVPPIGVNVFWIKPENNSFGLYIVTGE